MKCIYVLAALVSLTCAAPYVSKSDPEQPLMPYSFSWIVFDEASKNDYGHEERSDGQKVSGSYRVVLPDSRTQIVTYKADGQGYQADVKYDGQAQFTAAKYESAASDSVAAASYPAPYYPVSNLYYSQPQVVAEASPITSDISPQVVVVVDSVSSDVSGEPAIAQVAVVAENVADDTIIFPTEEALVVPVTESLAQVAAEPVEEVVEPTEPTVVEPAAEPEAEEVTETVTETANVAEIDVPVEVSQIAEEPAAEPVAEPVAEPAAEPAAETVEPTESADIIEIPEQAAPAEGDNEIIVEIGTESITDAPIQLAEPAAETAQNDDIDAGQQEPVSAPAYGYYPQASY